MGRGSYRLCSQYLPIRCEYFGQKQHRAAVERSVTWWHRLRTDDLYVGSESAVGEALDYGGILVNVYFRCSSCSQTWIA